MRRRLVLLPEALLPPGSLGEHDDDLPFADKLDRALDRLEIALAAANRKRTARLQDRAEQGIEELALRHEPELPSRIEREPEGPGIEIRGVVRREHESALGQLLPSACPQAKADLDERPANRGGKQVKGGHEAKQSSHFRLVSAQRRCASPSLLCPA